MMSNRMWALLALVVSVSLGLLAKGLAGDEEAFHYLVARYAPHNPELFLSLAGRPLLTLGLTLPSQLGIMGARLATALVTAGVAWGVARTARQAGFSPGWAVAFLMLQPFFLAHTGTAMTEPWAAFCLAWAVVALLERRWMLFAVMMGLLPLARLEWGLLFVPAGLALMQRRQWTPILVMGAPVLLLHLAGALSSGDWLWLLHQAQWKPYPERNADHYIQSFSWTLGAGMAPFIVLGMVAAYWIRGRGRSAALISLWIVGFALLVYTYLATYRPTTFGNLRYMAIVAPSLAVLGAVGIKKFQAEPRSRLVWGCLAAVALLSFTYWGKELYRDTTIMATGRFWPVGIAAAVILVMFLLPARVRRWAPLAALVFQVGLIAKVYTTTLHWEIRADAMVAHDMNVLLADPPRPGTINASPMFSYFSGLNPYDDKNFRGATLEALDTVPPGTLMFWETHYVPKVDEKLWIESILRRGDWKFVTGVVSADSSVSAAMFVKDGVDPPAVREGGWNQDAWLKMALIGQYGWIHSRNAVMADRSNPARWRAYISRSMMCGRFNEADEGLLELKALTGETLDYFRLVAEFERRAGQQERSYQTLKKAYEQFGNQDDLVSVVAMTARDMGRVEEAAELMTQAAQDYPQNATYQFAAGTLLSSLKRWDAAVAYLRNAVRLEAKYEHVAHLATALGKVGKWQESETLLRRAIDNAPHITDPVLRLGDIYLENGQVEKAREIWTAGLQRFQDERFSQRLAGL